MAVAAADYAEQSTMDADDKWARMSPDKRKNYVKRLRQTAMELMVARATRQGLQGKDIAKRTGYTPAWASNINNLSNQRFEALAEFATAVGYPLSFFIAMAEDLIELEDEKQAAMDAKKGDEES